MRPKSPPLHRKLIIDGLMCPRKGMSKFFLCLVGVYKRQVRPLDVSGFYVSKDVKLSVFSGSHIIKDFAETTPKGQ